MSQHDLPDPVELLLQLHPGLRPALRDCLDSGEAPESIRQRYGLAQGRTGITACAVEAIVAEWLAEVDAPKGAQP